MKYKFFYSVCFLFFGIITLMTSTSSVKAVEGTCHEINGKIAFNVEEDALVSHAGGDDDDYDQDEEDDYDDEVLHVESLTGLARMLDGTRSK